MNLSRKTCFVLGVMVDTGRLVVCIRQSRQSTAWGEKEFSDFMV